MTRRASSAGGPPILRTRTATQLAALSYLAVAVTAVVFLAWYGAWPRPLCKPPVNSAAVKVRCLNLPERQRMLL